MAAQRTPCGHRLLADGSTTHHRTGSHAPRSSPAGWTGPAREAAGGRPAPVHHPTAQPHAGTRTVLMNDRRCRSHAPCPPCPGSGRTGAGGPERPTVVVRACHPVRLRTARRTTGSQLPLEVRPHHLLRRHLSRPRPITLRWPGVCLRRLTTACRLSATLARLPPIRHRLVSVRRVFLSRGALRLVSVAVRATLEPSLGGSRQTPALSARSRLPRRCASSSTESSSATGGQPATNIGFYSNAGAAATFAANNTATPRRKANHTTARARRSTPPAEFSKPTVASSNSPSTDNGHNVALTTSAQP